jgi:CelD/BcsL family acetyltransferase involved in cellulose biosynthesis
LRAPPSVRVGGFEETHEEWEGLLASCPANTVFVTPWWQKVWWDHFGLGAELMILSVYDADRVLGIAPLMRKNGTISFLGDTDLCDYHDFLAPTDGEAAFYGALLDHLSTVDWRTIELTSLRADSSTLAHLPAIARGMGFEVDVAEEDKAPAMSLPPTWDEYVAALPKKDRHELRRKLRKLEAAGAIKQYVRGDPKDLREDMKDFFRLLRASSPDKAQFMTGAREEFFTSMAVELGSRGEFHLAVLEVDGIRVASCINLVYLDTCLLYNSGYDPDYSSLSVGILNKALAVKDAIETGKRSFDFLRGAERYKYSLGAQDRVIYRLTIRR